MLVSGSKPAAVEIWDTARSDAPLAQIEVKLPDEPLAKLTKVGALGGLELAGTECGGSGVKLKLGGRLKLVLKSAGEESVASPEYTP